MRLDRLSPFSEILGGPCSPLFEQGGRYFNNSGREVDSSGHLVSVEDEPEERPLAATPDGQYGSMHWKHLKVLVENYGHVWTSKEDAIRFLRGQQSV